MVFCSIGGASLTFPDEVGSLTDGLFEVSVRVRHFSFSLAGRTWTKIARQGQGCRWGNDMTFRRSMVFCVSLTSVVTVLGCAVQNEQSMPNIARAGNRVPSMPLYDVTAHYDAVKNRWFGLGDYATDQSSR
jgi:hypothetical protein